MNRTFDVWSLEQMEIGARCRVECSITCLPLRGDPICRACFESDLYREYMEYE